MHTFEAVLWKMQIPWQASTGDGILEKRPVTGAQTLHCPPLKGKYYKNDKSLLH